MQSKFTKKERLEIGRRIFEQQLNQQEAAVRYDINPYTARDYLRLYKATLAIREKGSEPVCHADRTSQPADMLESEER